MAFPGNVSRVVISGTLAGGEVWSVGFYREPIDAGTSMQSYAETIVASAGWTSLVAALRPLMAPTSAITRVQTYRYLAGRAATDYGTVTVGPTVGTGASSIPNQVAIVLTLRTALANRTGRGRMYWPATGLLVGSDGGVTTATLTTFVNAAGPFLDGNQAVVLSETATTTNPVIRVDADRIPDTMRSRTNKLTSTRISWTAP